MLCCAVASTDLLQKLYLVLAQASDSKRTWLWRRCSPCCTRPLCRCTPSETKSTALWKCRTEPYLLRVIKTRSRETDRIFPEHVGSALNMFDRIIHMTKAQEKGMRSCPTSFSSFELFCLSSTCRYFHFPPFKFKFNLEILNEVSPHTTTTSCRDPGT